MATYSSTVLVYSTQEVVPHNSSRMLGELRSKYSVGSFFVFFLLLVTEFDRN